jgi:hypothetical protein
MKKKPLAFMVAVSPPLAFAAGNVALSLRKQMPHEDYEIVIFYAEMTESDMAIFRSIPGCRLIKYEFPRLLATTLLEKSPVESRFRTPHDLMTFVRFECLSLLSEYRTVVALDADIAVQCSLADIVQYGPFGITSDAPWKVGDNFTENIPGYDMERSGVCAAILVVHDALPFEAMHIWCHAKTIELAPVLKNADQAIFNLALQEFGITPQLMPLEQWQCISWRDEANLANIVHFGTEKKVWCNENICNAFPEWYRVHREWLKRGGSDFDQSRIRPRNVLPILNSVTDVKEAPAEPKQAAPEANLSDAQLAALKATLIWRAKLEVAVSLLAAKQNGAALHALLDAVKSIEGCGLPHVTLEALLEICPVLARLDRGRALFLGEAAVKFAENLGRPAERDRLATLLGQIRPRPLPQMPALTASA